MSVTGMSQAHFEPAPWGFFFCPTSNVLAIDSSLTINDGQKPQPSTRTPSPYGPSGTLDYKKGRSIRFLPILGIPWFALPDCLDALGYPHFVGDVVFGPDFPVHARGVGDEAPDPDVPGDPMEVVLLSPVGVWYLTHLTEPCRNQGLAAWARRQAESLCPDASRNDPAMFLTVQPDGLLPPYPSRYSGRKQQWTELKEANPCLDWARSAPAIAA